MSKPALWVPLLTTIAVLAAAPAGPARAEPSCISPAVWTQFDVCPATPPVARDPSRASTDFAIAEALLQSKDWQACAEAFDKAYEDDPASSIATQSISKSVECRQQLRAQIRKDGADRKGAGNLPDAAKGSDTFAPQPISADTRAMLTSFDRFLCAVHADTGAPDDARRIPSVEFARARIYFEAQHWEEAALGFRKVALDYPDAEASIFAAQLYLEALNVLATHADPGRPACHTAMAEDVPKLRELHCAGAKQLADEAQCGVLLRIERDIERLGAERAYETANQHVGTGASVGEFRAAGEGYLKLWEKYGKEPCEKGYKESCTRSDESLWNAASAFLAGRDVDRAIAVWQTLVDPKFHLNDTDLGRRAVYRIGGAYQATARYEEAVTWFERFASESPKQESAPDALSLAVELRLGLGMLSEAIGDADTFAKLYGGKLPQRAAYNYARIGDDLVRHEEWDRARKTLTAVMGTIDRNAPEDAVVVAHAQLGRAYSRLGKLDEAKREYEKVRTASRSEKALTGIEQDTAEDERRRDARRVALFDAFSEAAFFFAERDRLALPRNPPPAFQGDADRQAATTFVADELGALRPVLEAFGAIRAASRDLSGGSFIVLGAVRVFSAKASLYATVVDDRANVPGHDALAADTSALLADVNASARTCLELGAQHHIADGSTTVCEQWLVDHDPTYVAIVELWSGSTRVGVRFERPPGLTKDGDPAID